MDIQQLDAVIRIAGAAALLFTAWLLLRDGKGRGVSLLFAPLAVTLSAFLAGNTPDPALQLHGLPGETAHMLSGFAAVFLWWFCLACFDPDFRPRGFVLGLGVAWLAIACLDRGLLGPWLADKGLSWLLVAMGFVIVGHLAWRLLRDRDDDMLEARRSARVLVVVLLGAELLVDLVVDLLFGFAWKPRAFTLAQNATILGFTLWFAATPLRARPDVLTFQASPAAPVPPAGADAALLARLRALVEVEQVHLDPELTFADFVRRMGAGERPVRQLINQQLGHDHFRSFLNVHRMAEAKRRLADPAHAGDKLIAIAMDSGFSSLASFNRVFRASEGCSPSAYRQAATRAGAEGPGFEDVSAAF